MKSGEEGITENASREQLRRRKALPTRENKEETWERLKAATSKNQEEQSEERAIEYVNQI